MKRIKILPYLLAISLILNLACLGYFVFQESVRPTMRLGALNRNLKVYLYGPNKTEVFELPKGITVKDISPRGLDSHSLIQRHRYSIEFISKSGDFVDFEAQANKENVYERQSGLYTVNPPEVFTR